MKRIARYCLIALMGIVCAIGVGALIKACAKVGSHPFCKTEQGYEGVWLPSVPMMHINSESNISEDRIRECLEEGLELRRTFPPHK